MIAISPKQSPSFRVRIGLVVLAEEELVRRNGNDRAQAEQEPEDIGPDSTENGHVLQEFDPRVLHGGTS
jgi:hypothetical protein